jgi:hypothetical protein
MSIEATSINELEDAEVSAEDAKLRQFLREENEALGVDLGAMRDFAIHPSAISSAVVRHDLARYLSARSLKQIEEDPTLADDDVVDGVLSNFGVTRLPGSTAEGRVFVVINALRPVVVAAGAVFTTGGRTYNATSTVAAKTEEDLVDSAGDVLLFETGDGNYAFPVTVAAAAEGPEYDVKRDAAFTLASPPTGFVAAYAAEDFALGRAVETNEDALARMRRGIAAKSPSNRICASAMLLEEEQFAAIEEFSIVGMRDAEMLRDKHWIFPFGGGGKVDWYVRSQPSLHRANVAKSCVCLSVDGVSSSTWRTTLDRDEAAGVYEVDKILPAGVVDVEGTLAVTSDVRQLDLTDADHDVETVVEGAYSRFQTITVTFTDNVTDTTDLTAGDTADYDFVLLRQPLIAELQDFLDADDRQPDHFDLLVRACVPCFVNVWIDLRKKSSATVDEDAVVVAVQEAVHASRFAGAVYSADIAAAVAETVGEGVKVAAIVMQGRLRKPSGDEDVVSASDVLEAPDLPDEGATRKTIGFFVDADAVSVSVVNSSLV